MWINKKYIQKRTTAYDHGSLCSIVMADLLPIVKQSVIQYILISLSVQTLNFPYQKTPVNIGCFLVADRTGFGPAISVVTGQRFNQLSYRSTSHQYYSFRTSTT